ncbi:hypothetical protein QTL97_17055 [Sporosarcina thermotolerans]|uniref:Lipoprotein n=1 Tax=Sporosarcina thermotolerans TaxID=633404 RepID=A0AAW9AAG4_9BACL|nr:hypothetical protein [Sporosarcina thermotolerans]MDW0118636.1 hypothetical protein [Sporosarcina thermotolerans]WHT49571.1 hypothetical protein QNH10_08715 [Sporosarcina thermotolerans]
MTRKKIMIIAIVILFTIISIKVFKKDLWEVNEELLKQEVLNIGESVESVNLSNVTPFEWDIMYSFHPYTSKDTIYKTVGYKWDTISESVSEGMNQLVFMKDEKVVCYLYGYPANNGYGIYFFNSGSDTRLTSASMLSFDDDLNFQVERRDSIIYLMKNG